MASFAFLMRNSQAREGILTLADRILAAFHHGGD